MFIRTQRLAVAAAAVVLITGGMLTGTASAHSATPAAAATTCQWTVQWSTVGVYEEPSRSSRLIKSKHAGDTVTGNCQLAYNVDEDDYYEEVNTTSASDGIGWMRLDGLKPV